VLGDEAPLLAALGDNLERRVAPLLYRRSRVVTASQSSKAEIVRLLGLRPERITVVENGVDSAFTPGGTRDKRPTVLAVGRLVPVKRHDLLVRAVAEARRAVPGLRLVLVGEGYHRPA